MSAFNNNSVTLKGAAIIASLVTGSTLTFTRIAVGDGMLASGQTALTRERLVNPLFNVPISSVESNNAAQAVVKGTFSNADLNTGFYYREIGLFAINPDTNAEELFLYGNASTEAEWINPAGQSSLIEKEIHLVTLIGNASNVTAVFDENAKVLKSEFDAIVPLKADLDAKPENGGRVLASQMRFDEVQNLYVDAAAANGGDGTQAKPFKTIAEAVNARYMGAPVVNIYIKPGTYAERVNVPRSPGTAWRFERAGTGTVSIQGLTADNPAFLVLDYLTFNPPAGSTDPCVSVLNCPHTSLSTITVNGNANITGVNISAGRARFLSCVLNNCGIGVVAVNGSDLTMRNTTGTGNNKGLEANSSVIITDQNIPGATTPYAVYNGGTINVQGGQSSFPSNYSQLYPLGTFSTADDLRTALLQTFGKLATNEIRGCWFTNAISGGFGIFTSGQALQIEVVKSAATHGIVFFKSYYNQPLAYMQIRNNAFLNALPVAFAKEEPATAATFGLIRTTSVEDEQNCQCNDAAVTPASLYDLSDYRRANVSYGVGAVVGCPYHVEFLLKCTQAGRTSDGALDTTGATLGKVYTDGGVKWEVVVLPVEFGGTGATTPFSARENLGLNSIATIKAQTIPNGADLNDYTIEGTYYAQMDSIGSSLLNSPVNRAFSLIVTKHAYFTQTLMPYS
ncbi:MAG: phage tail protein, partial [Phascolarctobacterium sp.]|nr:phage tail protein [Phascolarctobacterium sp.]